MSFRETVILVTDTNYFGPSVHSDSDNDVVERSRIAKYRTITPSTHINNIVVKAQLINQSVTAGVVPNQWKRAVITPVPKASKLMHPSDFMPISISPVLSRS